MRLDSTFLDGKAAPFDLSVPGLQEGYVPVPVDLGYYQYGVIPGYDMDVLLANLRELDEVDFATPVFEPREGNFWHCYNELLVTFLEEVSQAQIDSVVAANFLEVIRVPNDWQPSYTFVQTEYSPPDIFDLCAEIFESGLCYTSYPNLWGVPELSSLPNGTYFPRQWHLHHDSSFTGKPDADIDMVEAWEYAGGNSAVTIAIIDYAFDMNHQDVDYSQIRYAFDAAGQVLELRAPDSRRHGCQSSSLLARHSLSRYHLCSYRQCSGSCRHC